MVDRGLSPWGGVRAMCEEYALCCPVVCSREQCSDGMMFWAPRGRFFAWGCGVAVPWGPGSPGGSVTGRWGAKVLMVYAHLRVLPLHTKTEQMKVFFPRK